MECGVSECAGMGMQGARVNLRKSRMLVSCSGSGDRVRWRILGLEG